MAYSADEINEIFEKVCNLISDGKSTRKAIKSVGLSSSTFYSWLDDDVDKSKQYARACEERAEALADEILDIANHTEEDHTPFTGGNVVQRDKARMDALKWILSKQYPKKYGDKIDIDHTTQGEKIASVDLSIIPTDILEKMVSNENTDNTRAS